MGSFGVIVFALCATLSTATDGTKTKPNIIVIVADDMGFNDVSFHGSNEIPTPNIDALAYNGVILNRHYTQALCTPSRASLLTGKYPIHLGMQHLVILEPEPWGLPLNETLLPQHLKRKGYKTHAIGKWHLGFFKKEYTPTYRGFDTHYGYWQGFHDYYDHTIRATFSNEIGYDMRRNMSVDWDAKGKYSTTLFTEEAVRVIKEHDVREPMFMYLAHLAPHTGNDEDPLQAPDDEIAKFAHIADPERRIYAAMVSMLDQSVGRVITALREKHMLENSIILYMSDNGAKTKGIHSNHGSNYPLRGVKNSPWEGAMRNIAVIWSPLIKSMQRVSNELIHISDWLPTLYSAAGMNISELGEIDGKDLWKSISENTKSQRTELVYNIDTVWKYGALRQGDWKYVYGCAKEHENQWYGSSGEDPSYTYSEDAVLKSPVAVTLSGLTTYRQISEKYENEKHNKTGYASELLTLAKIKQLRKEATITCGKDNIARQATYTCNPVTSPCLFNIEEDPCEMVNLASTHPNIMKQMEEILSKVKKTVLPPINKPRDINADPTKWNGTWTNWADEEEVLKQKLVPDSYSPLSIFFISVACFGFFIIVVVLLVISLRKPPKSKFETYVGEDPMDSPAAAMAGKNNELKVMPVKVISEVDV